MGAGSAGLEVRVWHVIRGEGGGSTEGKEGQLLASRAFQGDQA